jgi:hypothetical protein
MSRGVAVGQQRSDEKNIWKPKDPDFVPPRPVFNNMSLTLGVNLVNL